MENIWIYVTLLGLLGFVVDYFARKDQSLAMGFIGSLHNRPEGFSARKLSAFTGVMISVYVTVKFTTAETLEGVLMIWLAFALLCMGIITFEQIIRFKGGAANSTDTPKTNVQS